MMHAYPRLSIALPTFTLLCLFLLPASTLADPGDTTIVDTFIEQNHNFGDDGREHIETFTFPDEDVIYSQVWMTYTQSCPPGGCDPWDRIGRLWVIRQVDDTTSEQIEIARVITPYNIVGGGGPGTCTWQFDMTEYQSILKGDVTLKSKIDTWIGGNRGWECTCTFYFVEGELSHEPYKVINLWDLERVVYGDPDNPPEEHLDQVLASIDDYAELMTLRVWTTGHGQGNTNNAAEFSRKDHGVFVGGQQEEIELWRENCEFNPCSPQGGTWQFDRAGWCPGDRVYPWDLTDLDFTPGSTLDIWYYLEPYENLCRPSNPDCQNGVTCPDCNYNTTGHTEPYYVTSGQLILWSSNVPNNARDERTALPHNIELKQNYPNPFNPETTIEFTIPARQHARLAVYDVTGREVTELINGITIPGSHSVHFDGSQLASGVYFYSLETAATKLTHKMLLLR